MTLIAQLFLRSDVQRSRLQIAQGIDWWLHKVPNVTDSEPLLDSTEDLSGEELNAPGINAPAIVEGPTF